MGSINIFELLLSTFFEVWYHFGEMTIEVARFLELVLKNRAQNCRLFYNHNVLRSDPRTAAKASTVSRAASSEHPGSTKSSSPLTQVCKSLLTALQAP